MCTEPPSPDADFGQAGTCARIPISRPRRWRSAPPPPHSGQPCLQVQESRAPAAHRPTSGSKPDAPAQAGNAHCERAHRKLASWIASAPRSCSPFPHGRPRERCHICPSLRPNTSQESVLIQLKLRPLRFRPFCVRKVTRGVHSAAWRPSPFASVSAYLLHG